MVVSSLWVLCVRDVLVLLYHTFPVSLVSPLVTAAARSSTGCRYSTTADAQGGRSGNGAICGPHTPVFGRWRASAATLEVGRSHSLCTMCSCSFFFCLPYLLFFPCFLRRVLTCSSGALPWHAHLPWLLLHVSLSVSCIGTWPTKTSAKQASMPFQLQPHPPPPHPFEHVRVPKALWHASPQSDPMPVAFCLPLRHRRPWQPDGCALPP